MRIRRIRTGTANPNFRHGNSLRGKVSPEYHAYNSAKRRCKDSRREDFKNYGGRGIKFLFKSFQEFLAAIGKNLPENTCSTASITTATINRGTCAGAHAANQ